MDDLWFYILFSNISVISEWREIGNDIEPRTLEIEYAWDVIILNIFVKLY